MNRLRIHLVIEIILAACLAAAILKPPAPVIPAADEYALQTSLYRLYHLRRVDTVMLGDSLMSHIDWQELLGRDDVVSRAIAGDTTSGVLQRLDEVIALHPRRVVVMLGINDFLSGRDALDVYANYQRILDRMIANQITPFIVTTLPLADWHPQASDINPQIDQLNTWLFIYTAAHRLPLIDLHRVIVAHPDYLSADGLHLTAPAYAAWRDLLRADQPIGYNRIEDQR